MGQKSKNYTENYTDNYPELDGINNLIPQQETLYTEEQVKKMIYDALINYEIGYKPQLPLQEICISCDEQKGTHKICMDCIDKMIKEKQQEISDEEIEKASYKFWEFKEHTQSTCWKMGAKWYREQLKTK